MVAPADCPSQAVYISYFNDAIAVLQTAAALERTAMELGIDSAAENIDYLEVRWAPRLHLRNGLTVPEVIDAVLAGLAAAPLRAVAIVCAMRQHTVEDNVALAREAGRFAGRGLVGFDLAGDEVRYPAPPQRPAFEAARAASLRLTCHAGEAGEPSHVEDALLTESSGLAIPASWNACVPREWCSTSAQPRTGSARRCPPSRLIRYRSSCARG